MMSKATGLVIILLIGVIISSLQVINAKHQNRQAFIALQNLKKQQDQMEIEWGQLQLEQATWAAHGRVEKIASKQTNL